MGRRGRIRKRVKAGKKGGKGTRKDIWKRVGAEPECQGCGRWGKEGGRIVESGRDGKREGIGKRRMDGWVNEEGWGRG
jgi:hypothetical protein